MALTDNTTGGRIVDGLHNAIRITLADTVEVGDMLGYSSGWVRALGTSPNEVDPLLVAGQAGVSGDVIEAYSMAKIGGLTGMTAGGYVYLALAALKGEVSEDISTTSGDTNVVVGFSLSTTEWLAMPAMMGVINTDTDHRVA